MKALSHSGVAANFLAAFLLTLGLFALLGTGHRLYDALIGQYARLFTLSESQMSFTRGIYSVVYFFGAIPAALYARRLGYKATIILGLGFVAVGAFLFYPASEMHTVGFFLAAAAVVSCGWILLEIAGNPIIATFGDASHVVQRLNLAQSAYPIGAVAGILIGRWFVNEHLVTPDAHSATAIAHPYILIGIGVLMLAFLIEDMRFPPAAAKRNSGRLADEFKSLFGSRLFCFALAAQFFSVVCLSGTWFQSERFFLTIYPSSPTVANIFLWAMTVYGAGRITGTVLMVWIRPERVLAAFCCIGCLIVFSAGLLRGTPAFVALLASSFTLSILWPTILGLAIRDLGEKMKLATALICMASSAGGIFFGQLQAFWQPPTLFVAASIPATCYIVVLAYALVCDRTRAAAAARRPDDWERADAGLTRETT